MDDIKNMFGKITKNITKTSSGVVKSVKLSMSLAGEEDKLKSVYYDIGKKVHEIYAYGGSLGSFFDEKYIEIAEIEKRIKELKSQIEISKGTKVCPNCSKSISESAVFCPKCGYKMSLEESRAISDISSPPKETISEPVTENIQQQEIQENSLSKTCSACGHENSAEDRFCLACGRNL